MRIGKLEYLVTTRRLEGKMDMGKPREIMLVSLVSWHGGMSILKMIGCTEDRRLWTDITYITWHGL